MLYMLERAFTKGKALTVKECLIKGIAVGKSRERIP